MATRGSALGRAIRYFKEADYEEAMVAQVRVVQIMTERTKSEGHGKPATKRVYKKRAPLQEETHPSLAPL